MQRREEWEWVVCECDDGLTEVPLCDEGVELRCLVSEEGHLLLRRHCSLRQLTEAVLLIALTPSTSCAMATASIHPQPSYKANAADHTVTLQ